MDVAVRVIAAKFELLAVATPMGLSEIAVGEVTPSTDAPSRPGSRMQNSHR